MLDDFKKGMGYANEPVGDTDVFFASTACYKDENDKECAIDSSLFIYDNDADKIVYLDKICSAGTAYPISLKDGCLYVGGHHNVIKYTVKDKKLVIAEEASEVFDTAGNATYYYTKDGGKAEQVEDDSNLTRLFEEYENATPIEYSIEKE